MRRAIPPFFHTSTWPDAQLSMRDNFPLKKQFSVRDKSTKEPAVRRVHTAVCPTSTLRVQPKQRRTGGCFYKALNAEEGLRRPRGKNRAILLSRSSFHAAITSLNYFLILHASHTD
jgi:hypothetical protein